MTDIEIAQNARPKKIVNIAKKLKINKKDIILYGDYKAKISSEIKDSNKNLILVTAITPTESGVGKTTVSIGLADALHSMKESVCLALREPSLGPVFGLKGGATGGGYSQVIPMEDINLHFTGDFHAITSANNLLSAMIDNHIYQGNELDIDPDKILFKRCLDMNDRALRDISLKGGRREHFVITAGSEIMAILCVARDMEDLKERLGNILIAFDRKNNPVFARDLKVENALAILLKDALYPNLVQTLEGTPALIHLGPFANIAHGCNSLNATKLSMMLADYTITEAGFGSDLGAEKFLDFKCRIGEIKPNCVVIVTTINALKIHGKASILDEENIPALDIGFENLEHHMRIIQDHFKLPFVVAINKYSHDLPSEINYVSKRLKYLNIDFAINNSWEEGSKGATELAKIVKAKCLEDNSSFEYTYDIQDTPSEKINKICKNIYGAKEVIFSELAKEKLDLIKKLKLNKLPIIIAKTPYSLSDNKDLINVPKDFNINITDIEIRSGAGYIVAIAGKTLLMPALGKIPNAMNMEIDSDGKISGLF